MDLTQPLQRSYMAHRKGDSAWNFLTMLVLLLGLCAAGFFVMLNFNDARLQVPLQPADPPSEAAAVVYAPTPEQDPVEPQPTGQAAGPGPEIDVPTGQPEEPAPISAPISFPEMAVEATFDLRGEPVAIASQVLRSDGGCSWTGIAGEAYDLQGSPVTGLLVKVGGSLDGKPVDLTGMTGTVLGYGPAGYELTVGDYPVESQQSLWVQLFDQAGVPLSERVALDTFGECDKNLLLVNFKQIR